MKLEAILDNLNSFEKHSFLKIIDGILADNPKNSKLIENILTDKNKELKNADNVIVARVFALIKDEFAEYIKSEFVKASSQFDILVDIIIRDGNCIMKQDWFARLYEKELKTLDKKVNELKKTFESEKSDVDELRKRDYSIYKACLEVAYTNDDNNNQDRKITQDELSILLMLSKKLDLSQEEVKLINYTTIPVVKLSIDTVINDLKTVGVVFYDKDVNTVYVADEIVRVLRKVRGKEVADKFFRRVLRLLKPAQLNMLCKKHNIDWRQSNEFQIKSIIKEGISFTGALSTGIFKENTSLTERKKYINEFCVKGLKITSGLKGATIEEKLESLVNYFEEIEQDEKVGISIDGYEKLLIDLSETLKKLNSLVKEEFELQEEDVLKSKLLLDYNIKPRDIIELIDQNDLTKFCKERGISTRGDDIENILSAYKDADNLYLESYEDIGFRNLAVLKENGLNIKEGDLGVKFEAITKDIFTKLGFLVDEKLRRSINTKKDKIDILLNLGNNELILVECKTIKESGYNKFSSVSRQLKAYFNLVRNNGYKVVKSLLIAPDFSDDFVSECELEYDLNLSLISASSLYNILEGFKQSKHKQLPYRLLMRDVLIKEDRIVKAIKK